VKNKGPQILTIDIETSPIEAYVWGIFDQNIGVNQIKKDWKIISVAWKWLDREEVFQLDVEKLTEFTVLKRIRQVLDMADIVVGQNSKKFDVKKINARLVIKNIRPPSSFQQIDTRLLAKKYFGFTSNSLEYLSDKLNKKYKKLKHKDFPGQELWTECLKGNPKAWKAMREYNKFDVLATEELYKRLVPYDNTVNFNVYYDEKICTCGSEEFYKNGYAYTSTGKYQRFECKKCGSELKSHQNLLKTKVLRGVKR
jgi:RNase_H superfamily